MRAVLLEPNREAIRSALILAATVLVTWTLAAFGAGPGTIFVTGLGATVASERHYLIFSSKQYPAYARLQSGLLFGAIWFAFLALGVSSLLWVQPV